MYLGKEQIWRETEGYLEAHQWLVCGSIFLKRTDLEREGYVLTCQWVVNNKRFNNKIKCGEKAILELSSGLFQV